MSVGSRNRLQRIIFLVCRLLLRDSPFIAILVISSPEKENPLHSKSWKWILLMMLHA